MTRYIAFVHKASIEKAGISLEAIALCGGPLTFCKIMKESGLEEKHYHIYLQGIKKGRVQEALERSADYRSIAFSGN